MKLNKFHTGWNSIERMREKKKFKSSIKIDKVFKNKGRLSMKKIKKSKGLKKISLQIKKNFESQTRNNESEEWLSTISPNNIEKNIINDDEITIKFTDEIQKDIDQSLKKEKNKTKKMKIKNKN